MMMPSSFYAPPANATLTQVKLVGKNADIDNGTVPEHIWSAGGAFTFLTAAEALTAVSSSTDDTADPNGDPITPGTGARTVTITGLTSAYATLSETVSLDGTTAATTTNDFLRVNAFEVASAGSGAANAGTVTLAGADTTTATLGVIAIGANRATQTHYTVPTGKKGYIVGVRAAATNTTTSLLTADLRVREYGGLWKVVHPIAFDWAQPYESRFEFPIEVGARADIELRVETASANNNVVTAEIDLLLLG